MNMPLKPTTLDFNPEFRRALQAVELSGRNVFVTGRAGTGKSTLLDYFRNTTKKNVAVLAPTGVAALNVRGQTIHSFCGFRPGVTSEKAREAGAKARKREDKKTRLYRALEAVVIDEISMVRADLFDCLDQFLRSARGEKKRPFGGCQAVMIGDLYQLPPVVTGAERGLFRDHYRSPYFFAARVFDELATEYIELEKIYRQKDNAFIALLNAVRNNSVSAKHLAAINRRVGPRFAPPPDRFYITLTPTNDRARQINEERLGRIAGRPHRFTGTLHGLFGERDLPTDIELVIKRGAQVMMVNNDAARRWVNGSVGRVERIEDEAILVRLENGETEEVVPYTWEIISYSYNEDAARLESNVVGSFTQYPLRLAWAITIHKSQGKTFERVILDMDRGAFAAGQTYVALSRCTSLEGLVLRAPLAARHVRVDWNVVRFVTRYQYERSAAALPTEEKVRLLEEAADAGGAVEITYLKGSDEKSRRVVEPKSVRMMEYQGFPFLGLEAYCRLRRELRTFRVEKILELKPVSP